MMNYLARIFSKTRIALLSAVLGSLLLSACGGDSSSSTASAGVGGTGIGVGGTGIVVGSITGFGSVYINGTRYDTSGASFVVDGENLSESELKLGMVVKIEAETEDGNFTGNALKVVYDDEVQGPVDATPVDVPGTNGTRKTFEVFGESVTIDDTGTRFEGTSFADIDANDVVEISGFRTTAPDTIVATYVREISTTPVGSAAELRGTIINYTNVVTETFDIRINGIDTAVTVDRTDPDLELKVPGGVLENGLYVEVKGILTTATEIEAKKIELEDEDFGDEVDDVRLEGIISEYSAVPIVTFKIDGQLINADGAEIKPMGTVLANGLEVEVEGDIIGGTFIADEIEVDEEESELRSFVQSVNVGDSSFEVIFPVVTMPNTVTVRVDTLTAFEDETGAATPPFSLDDLAGGGVTDYVIVKGSEVGNEIHATLVKRVTAAADEKRELEGIVDGYDAGVSITVLGIQYGLNGSTQYDPMPPNIAPGDFVEIEDKDDTPTYFIDGIADEVEEE